MLNQKELIAAIKSMPKGYRSSYVEACRYLAKDYGKNHGVTDTQFYAARKKAKQELDASTFLTTSLGEAQLMSLGTDFTGKVLSSNVKEQKEITIDELRAVNAFCKTNGGIAHVRKVMEFLESLYAY